MPHANAQEDGQVNVVLRPTDAKRQGSRASAQSDVCASWVRVAHVLEQLLVHGVKSVQSVQ